MSNLEKVSTQVFENATFDIFCIMQPHEMIGKFVSSALLCSSIALSVACGPQNGSKATRAAEINGHLAVDNTRTLNRGLLGEPRTLDPHIADDSYSFQVIRDLYEGLTAEDREGKIVPGVSNAWTADQAGIIYTFQLRLDAKWSDGKPVVAAEFVQGLRHAVDPKSASGSAAILSVIKNATEVIAGRKDPSGLGVKAVGEQTVQIELEHPAPYILEILSQPIAAPLHLDASVQSSEMDRNPATNGPYVLSAHFPGSYIELERNTFYWDVKDVDVKRVRYLNSESEATELREYMAGQLDLTYTIPTPDFERISLKYPSEIEVAPSLATLYLALNLSNPSLGKSKELRQALSMAVDRQVIADRIVTGATPAYAFVAKGVTGYDSPLYAWSSWTREHQLDLARNLYAKAGYSLKNPLHLQLYFNRDEGIHRLMVAIAGSWKQNLGVESQLLSDEFRVFLVGRRDKSKWDVARLGWTADYDDASSFLEIFTRHGGQNDPGYVSKEFNEAFESAVLEPRPTERLGMLEKSEKYLLDDYPIIPIYFYNTRRLVKPYVGGAVLTPMNHTYSKHLFWKSPP